MPDSPTTATPTPDQLPRGILNAYLFQATSSSSWQMCMASLLILFVRELGASSLVLGWSWVGSSPPGTRWR